MNPWIVRLKKNFGTLGFSFRGQTSILPQRNEFWSVLDFREAGLDKGTVL